MDGSASPARASPTPKRRSSSSAKAWIPVAFPKKFLHYASIPVRLRLEVFQRLVTLREAYVTGARVREAETPLALGAVEWARRVERALTRSAGSVAPPVQAYISRFDDLATALAVNPHRHEWIASLAPEALALLPVDVLQRDLPIAHHFREHIQKVRAHQQLLDRETKRLQEEARPADSEEARFVVRCRRCKSTEIDAEERQSRSADEPTSMFYTCRNCMHKWKR